jgi:hypothetical protein
MRKITGILICLMLVLSIVPLVGAINTSDNKTYEPPEIEKFGKCYVEISGNVTFDDWPRVIAINFFKIVHRSLGDHNGSVWFWLMIFDPDATVNVYAEKGGELLYAHQGSTYPDVRIFFFRGHMVSSEATHSIVHYSLDGTARRVKILEREGINK